MNDQDLFDKVTRHLLKQMKKSVMAMDTKPCAYRGEGGTKCAIGCLIPDDLYSLDYEYKVIDDLIEKRETMKRFFTGYNIQLMRTLQGVHDTYRPEHWRAELKNVAKQFNLIWREEHDGPRDLQSGCNAPVNAESKV